MACAIFFCSPLAYAQGGGKKSLISLFLHRLREQKNAFSNQFDPFLRIDYFAPPPEQNFVFFYTYLKCALNNAFAKNQRSNFKDSKVFLSLLMPSLMTCNSSKRKKIIGQPTISYNVYGLDHNGIRFVYQAVYCHFNLRLMDMIEHFVYVQNQVSLILVHIGPQNVHQKGCREIVFPRYPTRPEIRHKNKPYNSNFNIFFSSKVRIFVLLAFELYTSISILAQKLALTPLNDEFVLEIRKSQGGAIPP